MPKRRRKTAAEPLKLLAVSLGCAKNWVDTEVMCGALAQAGLALTNDPEQADLMLINTCGFIEAAREESALEIESALAWRAAKPGRRVVVSGCLPQRDVTGLSEVYPEVDLYLGINDVPDVAARLAELLAGAPRPAPTAGFAQAAWIYDHVQPRLLLTPGPYAYVKIADGCGNACNYCAIPRIRGPQRSRPIESIAAECRDLLGQDVCEINLVAQDSTRYGRDRDDGAALLPLLDRLETLEGDFWLRLLYTNPRFFPDELIDRLAAGGHLLPYVDMPLQHVSSRVLKAMGRGIDGPAVRALLERLRERVPGLAIRTGFLVGYPGETEADFAEILDFMRDFRFDRVGFFSFSPEEGTPAARITTGLVPPEVAAARRDAVMSLQQEISLAHNQALVGRELAVLVDRQTGPGRWIGRTWADAPDVDNHVHFTAPADRPMRGILPVRITAAEPYDLHGEAI